MAPIEPLLPGELALDQKQTDESVPLSIQTHPSSSSRRRSHSVTAGAMLAATDSEPPLSRSPSTARTSDSRTTASRGSSNIREKLGLGGVARRTLGIGLLLVVVFLWTTSNFLASVSPSYPSPYPSPSAPPPP